MKTDKMSFEQAMTELEEIVGMLEKGDLSLDESIDYFQKGVELSQFCNKRLNEAERKIVMLVEKQNGELTEEEMHGGSYGLQSQI